MNIPEQCHHLFLLPPEATVTAKLQQLYPTLFEEKQEEGDPAKCESLLQLFSSYVAGRGKGQEKWVKGGKCCLR